VRELPEQDLVLGGREHRDDALNGLRRAGSVHGGKHLVPGVRRAQRHPQRLDVAQLAHQDHVWVLSQRLAKCLIERDAVGADFELRDQRPVVAVQVLDRVLDRDHLHVVVVVDQLNHRRQRRAFAAAGRAGDQGQAPLREGDVHHGRRKVKLFDGRNDAADGAHGDSRLPDGEVRAAPEPPAGGVGIGEIEPLRPLDRELPLEMVGQHLRDLRVQLPRGDRRRPDPHQRPVQADDGLTPAVQVNVRCPGIDGLLEQRSEIHQRFLAATHDIRCIGHV
jgi:hypothetical protein